MKKTLLTITVLIINLQLAITQGESFFDDSFLHEIHINEMDTGLIDGSKVYQMVNMVIDKVPFDSVGIKEKGNISNNVPDLKVPFKIKMNKYVSGKKIDGIKEFTLHNNYEDPSMMREKITYDICAQMGLFALRTAYAKVYINRKYWGLYTIVEGKDEMFKQVFDNRDADAIESLDFGDMCYISNNPDDYNSNKSEFPYYQHENGDESSAFNRFMVMIDKANNTPDGQYIQTVSSYINLKDFFTYQAVNVYLMNMDSYIAFRGNQIYMYDESNNLFQIIPWDFNASLGLWNTYNANPDNYPVIPEAISNGCVASKMNTIPELKSYYLDAMCAMVNDICSPENMNNTIDKWNAQIKDAVYADYRKTFTNQEFDESLETGYFEHNGDNVPALKTFFSARYNVISQGLSGLNYTCSLADNPVKNESAQVKIFPKLVSDFLFIETGQSIEKVAIYNSIGQRVKSYNPGQKEIIVSDLPAGVYIVSVHLAGMITNQKVVIE